MDEIHWQEYLYKGKIWNPETIRYYGTYDGLPVFYAVGGAGPAIVEEIKIGGVFFEYSNGLDIWVYKEGELLALKRAYEQDYIPLEDLQKIADLHIQRELAMWQDYCQKYNKEHPDKPPKEIPDWLKPYQK